MIDSTPTKKTATESSATVAEASSSQSSGAHGGTASGSSPPAGRLGEKLPSTFPIYGEPDEENREWTAEDFSRSLRRDQRQRYIDGHFESGDDVRALRRFIQCTQEQFAEAMGISVHTLRNWEQGRRRPEGPAIALLRIAARSPRMVLQNLKPAG